MQLRRLRHQILLAMGLPACWTGQSPDRGPPPPPPPDRGNHVVAHPDDPAGDPWTWQPNPAAATQTRCTPETACGRSSSTHGPGCGPHGDSLESFSGNYQKMSVTQLSWGAHPGELRTFDLDPGETARYQTTVTVGSGVDRYCCYSQCTPSRLADRLPVAPPGMRLVTSCSAAPVQVSTPHHNNPDCPATQGKNPYTHGTNSQCCYGSIEPIPPPAVERDRPYRGRAARVAGDAVVAPVRGGRTWSDGLRPRTDGIAAATCAALRDAWQVAAQMEHASIAAFSALSLRLIALGAPADLIARTHEAALDEIRHARIAFALASAYADAPLEPARFDDVARLPVATTLAALARETFLDGCIEETAAAVDAALAAGTATDPVVADALRAIAEDEGRHAELAWAIVAWCVRSEPAIANELQALLAEQLAAPRAPESAGGPLAGHGVRSDADSARTKADVVREIVAPCLAALA